MTICGNNDFYCKIVFCSIIRKNQLLEPPLVPISSDNRRFTVYPIRHDSHRIKLARVFNSNKFPLINLVKRMCGVEFSECSRS